MGKKTLIAMGIGIVLLGAVGVFNAIDDLGAAAPVGDQSTTGKITSLARLTKGDRGTPSFSFMYAFRSDGRVFFGEQTIDKAAYESLKKGDQVTVHYESDNPRASSAATNAGDSPEIAYIKTRLKVCGGTAVFGLLITVLACFCQDEKRRLEDQAPKKFSEDPVGALQKWRSEWQIEPAPIC